MRANIIRNGYKGISAGILRSLDFACIGVGYLLASWIAATLNMWQLFSYPSPNEWAGLPLTLLPLTLVSWGAVSGFSNTYVSHRDEGLDYVTRNLLKTIFIWAAVSLGAVFLVKLRYSSRQFTLEFICCVGVLIVARQIMTILFLRRLRRSGFDQKTALVMGQRESCERFASMAMRSHPMGYHFVPVSLTSTGEFEPDSAGELGTPPAADEIFIIGASPNLERHESPALRFLKQGKAVHIVPEVVDAKLFRQSLGEIGGMPVLTISCGQLSGIESFAKRTVDLICASVLLLLSAPIWMATALVVKLTSSGPVLFRQERLGKQGRTFTLFKFRTMRVDAEQELQRSAALYQRYVANNYKLPPGEDPRLTPIGAFLRAISLDELPQLLNVARGEMSLVGPRPILPNEIHNYGDFASLFLSVRPGMTGQWQVSGRSEIREYDRRVELDLEYIRDQSIRTDFEILLRTVPTVLGRKGAY